MLRYFRLALPVWAALSAGILSAAPAPAAPIAAELFFKPPEFTLPAVSPDGKSVGFIAQSNGHACLFKLDLKTSQISGLFSAGEGEVEYFWWAGDQRVLIAGRGRGGRLEYFVQDLSTSKPRSVAALEGCPPQWVFPLPSDPEHVHALIEWREGYLARINLLTGHSTKIESLLSDFNHTAISASGELRAKFWQSADKWHIAWRPSAQQPWQTLESSNEDWPAFMPAGMAADDRHILVYAYDQGDTIALMQLDPATGQRTLLCQQPDRDVFNLFHFGQPRAFLGAKFNSNTSEDLRFFDMDAQQFSALLDNSLPGLIHYVTSSSTDGKVRIIEAWPPGYPSRYYLFDQTAHRLSLLGEERPELVAGGFGEVRPFKFVARDGLAESGFMVLPKQFTEGQPVPLIVIALNGAGEWLPSASSFSARDQFFANRGYAVAHVSVRGSQGFGRAFEKAGDFHMSDKVVQDLEDGVAFLARAKLIDPHRVALFGTESGGLFALRTAAISHSFHAVVAFNARADLNANSIGWLSSSIAETPVIVKQAGGTKAAYDLVHQFETESYMEKMSVPALLIYTSWYGSTSSMYGSPQIRTSFDKHHKQYEWFELDLHAAEHVKTETYLAQLYPKITDFLDRNLK